MVRERRTGHREKAKVKGPRRQNRRQCSGRRRKRIENKRCTDWSGDQGNEGRIEKIRDKGSSPFFPGVYNHTLKIKMC